MYDGIYKWTKELALQVTTIKWFEKLKCTMRWLPGILSFPRSLGNGLEITYACPWLNIVINNEMVYFSLLAGGERKGLNC